MTATRMSYPAGRRWGFGFAGVCLAVCLLGMVGDLPVASGQAVGGTPAEAGLQAGPSAGGEDAQLERLASAPAEGSPTGEDPPSGIDLLTLIARGGAFMWPIGLMSLLVVTLGVERLVTFRRNRLIPRKLVRRLETLMRAGDGCLDAEAAMVACREHRSVTATVVTSMLMRVGRPLSEIEQAANETAQREADSQAGPIRWLNLAAAATPLMGLLGTVWGMIVAFHNSTTLTADRSRSEQLSEGIYTALVTTLAGLAVAIPAAILAQYLENRLTKLFHRIEKLAFSLSPSLEHYEGRVRMDADQRIRPLQEGVTPAVPPPVVSEGSAVDRQAGGERPVGDGRGVSSPHRRASDAAVRQR